MPYEAFSNDSSVNTVKTSEDEKVFNHIKKTLGFSLDLHLVTFCAAIGLYQSALKKKMETKKSPPVKKLVPMSTFKTRYMYDYITKNFLDIQSPRIKDFDEYFYTGFLLVKNWFTTNGPNMENNIHAFSELISDLLEDEDIPKPTP